MMVGGATVRVRRETRRDVAETREVVAAAFGEEPVAELVDELRRASAWLDLSFVAEDDSGIVGHVCFTRGWVDAPRRVVEVLVLSPLSVRPDRQRQGVGGRLVHETLRILRSREEPLVFLEGDPGYYPRLGFVPGRTLGFSAPSVRIPDLAFQVITQPSYQPWMRGALVYPDVFWANDSVGLRDLEGGED
jgi:putative acetyltransferase